MSEAAERRARRRMYRTGAGFARNEYLAPTGGDRRRPPPGRRHARPGRLRQHDRHRADDRDDQTPAEPGEPVTRPPSRPVPSRARFGAATALRAAGVRPRTVDSRSSASATPRRPCRPLLSVRSSRIRSFSSCLPGARDGPPTGETCSDYDTVCVKSSHGLGRKVFEGGRRSERHTTARFRSLMARSLAAVTQSTADVRGVCRGRTASSAAGRRVARGSRRPCRRGR